MFCSKETNGFYDPALSATMPVDAVEISRARYLELLAGRTSGLCISFDPAGQPILADPPGKPVEQLQAEVWEAIRAERERRTFAGFNVSGQWVHSDLFSRSQWLGLKDNARDALAAGGAMDDTLHDNLGQVIVWKMLGGAFVPVTAQLAFDVVAAVTRSDMDIFTAAEQHNAAMRAATDPVSYVYSTGWPQTYGEFVAVQEPVE